MAKPLDETELYRAVGQRLAAARKRVTPSISQATLASRAGLTRGSIANIERGYQHPPLETLFRLALALGTEPRLLVPAITELGLVDGDGAELTIREKASIKKLGLEGGVTEQWVRRAKATGDRPRGSHDRQGKSAAD